jgi:uncharacterized delta-60 repeat protein
MPIGANGSTLSFESAAITLTEGQTRVITVTRTGAAIQPLTATVTATPGTADISDFHLLNTVTPTVLHKLDGYVRKIAVQPDGKLVAGGAFTVTNGVTYTNIARFNPNGSLDNTFTNSRVDGIEGEVYDLVLLPNGKFLVTFRHFSYSLPRSLLLRLNPNGTVDNTFNKLIATSNNQGVSNIIVQPDGKILLFSSITDKIMLRLFADGTIDNSFNAPNRSDYNFFALNTLALQADGKVIVGGWCYNPCPEPRENVMRLNADGSFDRLFPKIINVEVYSLLVQPDGKIIAAGGSLTGKDAMGRYNPDGSVDANFPNYPVGTIGYLIARSNGKFAGGIGRAIGKFNADGSFDNSFRYSQNNAAPFALNVQADDKIVAAIDFDYSPNQTPFIMPQTDLVRLDPRPTLSWAAGETGTKTFTVTATADNLPEFNEQFELGLQFTEGGVTSVSPAKATVTIFSTTAPTELVLSSTPNPSAYGSLVTFTATISPTIVTGNVTFRRDNELLGSANLANGIATITTTNLSGGSHVIKASYFGNASYGASSSPTITQVVEKLPSSLNLSISSPSSRFGAAVVLTAEVSPPVATGTVIFKEGATVLGQSNVVSGSAVLTVRNLGIGSHVISATYNGDINYEPSQSPTISLEVLPPANSFVVTKTTDNGWGDTVGTFSYALKMVGQLQSSSSITFALEAGDTITFTRPLLYYAVPPYTIIDGEATQIILDGNGQGYPGLYLHGNNILRNLWLRNFIGSEITIQSGGNKLENVRITS